ncbi:Gp138 family membrane-puncturing spike protein [Paenibacillus sp. SI8]|uniref:Gp138 family membrane-puncturing spike protein n=1 Tax=unclassified Paenibacillus TaxID=185978 RepID=UPI003467448E
MSDPAGALAGLILGVIEKSLAALNVSFPCRVVSFDSGTCMAVVQPLIKSSSGAEPSPIQNVPALGQRMIVDGVERVYKPALREGDAVLVVCTDQELKNVLAGTLAQPSSKRTHNNNDAVIVGVMPCSLLN